MRLFCAVRHSLDPGRYYGNLWSANFLPALRALGHDVIESAVDLLPTSQFMHIGADFTAEEREVRAQTTDLILDAVRAAHRQEPLDLFLSYFYNAHFDPAGFDELRRLGIPSLNFFCNSIYQFELVSAVAAKTDYAWHAERDARASYLRVGANPVWVQMGADPAVYKPLAGVERTTVACFIGQRYADRDRWMAALVGAKVPVAIYGPGWGAVTDTPSQPEWQTEEPLTYLGRRRQIPGTFGSYLDAAQNAIRERGLVGGLARVVGQMRYRIESKRLSPLLAPHAKGAIPFTRIAEVLSAHEVCLNFSNVWADGRPRSSLIPHVRLRDFEAPMCGACYLTGHLDEIAEFYEIGKEIDTYRTEEELVSKARFYLEHPEAAERLRNAGHARAVRDHTWVQRFRELFRKTGLPETGLSNNPR